MEPDIFVFYKATIADVLSQDDLMCVAVQHMQILPSGTLCCTLI